MATTSRAPNSFGGLGNGRTLKLYRLFPFVLTTSVNRRLGSGCGIQSGGGWRRSEGVFRSLDRLRIQYRNHGKGPRISSLERGFDFEEHRGWKAGAIAALDPLVISNAVWASKHGYS